MSDDGIEREGAGRKEREREGEERKELEGNDGRPDWHEATSEPGSDGKWDWMKMKLRHLLRKSTRFGQAVGS